LGILGSNGRGALPKLGGEGKGDGIEGHGQGCNSWGQLNGQEPDTTINGQVARSCFDLIHQGDSQGLSGPREPWGCLKGVDHQRLGWTH